MDENEGTKIALECSLRFVLKDPRGAPLQSGEAAARLDEGGLSLLPADGEALYVSYRDILFASSADYAIRLGLAPNESMELERLGYRFEDFLRILHRFRNETLIADLLMQEPLLKPDVPARFRRLDAAGTEIGQGSGKVRIYRTSLVLIPENGEFLRVFLADISGTATVDTSLTIAWGAGEKLVLSQMGNQLDSFARVLSGQAGDLALKAQSALKTFSPGTDPSVVRQAARLMKEGRAALRSEFDAVAPEIWGGLEKSLTGLNVGDEYKFLKPLSRPDKIAFGWKRGLTGGETADYFWFLFPLYSTDPGRPGNALAWEATTGDEEQGRATYFFRMTGRGEYAAAKGSDDLDRTADAFIRDIGLALRTVNFRREPIYLPEERLSEPAFARYKFAVRKIPELRTLRDRFIGRVIHESKEQWEKDVLDLLTFNVTATDDAAVWVKSEEAPDTEGV
jgi:hypothetical protein